MVVLVVDPEPPTSSAFAEVLGQFGFHALRVTSGREALERFHSVALSLVLLDLDITDMPGRQLLRHFRSYASDVPIIALSSRVDVSTAVEDIQAGATEIIEKSSGYERFRIAIQQVLPQAIAAGRQEARDRARVAFFADYEGLFRRSEQMKMVETLVMRVADTDSVVLVQGEPGTGKGLVAKAIHYLSRRSGKPWKTVNCTSLPADLLELEIFGYGGPGLANAPGSRPGTLDLADGGTLLLDEIGDLPGIVQPRIAHVLRDGQFFRAGERELIRTDVRILATTTRDIKAMAGAAAFSEDLQRLIDVVSIVVPPLRERREEIIGLADHFRSRFAAEFGRPEPRLSNEILELLNSYGWPGNVRELEGVIKRWVVLGDDAHLKDELVSRTRVGSATDKAKVPPSPRLGLREIGRHAARAAEQAALREALKRTGGNRAATARALKISYKTLLQKLSEGGDPENRSSGAGR